MRKIITFLGTKPQDAIYEWQGKSYPGKVFAEALRQFVNFDRMLVLTTSEAAEKTWPLLAALEDTRIDRIPIPDASDQEGMWGIFQAVIAQVDEGETVVFDITHGFRTLPFLAFLFAAYLKTAKKVKIEAIYYGALEMSKQNNGKAPVIDLSQFVDMLDWISATDQFTQTGNAQQLAALLNPQKKQKGSLADASRTLLTISQAAMLCQPFTLMHEVNKLEPVLLEAEPELKINARPFGILREQIVSAFAQFTDDGKDVARQLQTEYQLLEWYYQKGQLIQAVTLAREWLIDAVTYRLGQPLEYAIEKRRPLEDAISGVALLGKKHPQDQSRLFTEDDLNRFGLEMMKWDNVDGIKQLWTDLKNVRNPLDHAEHQPKKENKKSLDELTKLQDKMSTKIMPVLRNYALEWDLAPDPMSSRP